MPIFYDVLLYFKVFVYHVLLCFKVFHDQGIVPYFLTCFFYQILYIPVCAESWKSLYMCLFDPINDCSVIYLQNQRAHAVGLESWEPVRRLGESWHAVQLESSDVSSRLWQFIVFYAMKNWRAIVHKLMIGF